MKKFLGSTVFLAISLSPMAHAEGNFELAQRVGAIVGIGQNGACSSCHASGSIGTIRRWGYRLQQSQQCLDNASFSSLEKLSCLSGSDASADFTPSPAQLGFYSAALHLEPMQKLLVDAYGSEKAAAISTQLRTHVQMPLRGSNLLSADDFTAISDWVNRGMPFLRDLVQPPSSISCEDSMSPAMRSHVIATARDNWQTRNEARGLASFACPPSGSTQTKTGAMGCFQQARNGQPLFPDIAGEAAKSGWKTAAQTQLRLLAEFPAETDYWIRSSADGRFVAFGGWPSGVIDLQSRLTSDAAPRVISVDAYYDPGFFPDDSAFMFQGQGTGICQMSLLRNPSTQSIDFSEDACTSDESVELPLYQAIGASLDGSDYLAATGAFESDPGHGRDFFSPSSLRVFDTEPENALYLFPLQYDGQAWVRGAPQVFDAGTEIDWGLAPSNRLLVSRKFNVMGDSAYPHSYQFYELKRSSGSQSYQKESLGQLCLKGLKGNFSFDDRFFVTYNHVEREQYKLLGFESPNEPAFLELLEKGSGNVFLHDLLSGSTQALTRMGPGQYAQFPHFRSDDWLYFMVYDSKAEKRYLLGSDAALQAKKQNPTPTTAAD